MHYRFTRGPSRGASKIDITQPAETSYWAHKFGCTAEQLRAAVKLVGGDAAAVTNYFLQVISGKRPMAV